MREKFAENGTTFITTYYTYEGKDLDKIKYGLLTFYSYFTKTSVVFIIAIILGTFLETILFKCCYALIRSFAFGIHASKNIYCWLTTIFIYILVPYLIKTITINEQLKFWIIMISIFSFLLYAPSDTEKRPLINRQKRHFSKLMSLAILMFFELIIIFTKNNLLVNSAIFSLIIECICLWPITYKIFRMPYNNYKTYAKKV